MIVRSFLAVLALLCSFISTPAHSSVKALDIQNTVNAFLQQYRQQLLEQYGSNTRISYKINALDARLAMADCPVPLHTQLKSTNRTGRVNLKVSCQQTAMWSIYVPVEINLFRPVVVAISPMIKNQLINNDQLQLREMDISKLNGRYYTDISEVAGMQTKKPLQADWPILATQLQPPLLIKKGESVLITANSGSLVVKTPAIALMDGHQGEQISVRNRRSKRVVEGWVTGPGQVRAAM